MTQYRDWPSSSLGSSPLVEGDRLWFTGQTGSPLIAEIHGRAQVIAPQGDGWMRAFDAVTGELIWEFDMNPQVSSWDLLGRGDRNTITATPVPYEGRVYIASGLDFEEFGLVGPGRLVCIDPTKSGDISGEEMGRYIVQYETGMRLQIPLRMGLRNGMIHVTAEFRSAEGRDSGSAGLAAVR